MNKKMLLSLVDKVIKVDRGGPEWRVGLLLSAEDDYFTLLTENDGIIYYSTQHIKSLTNHSKNQTEFNLEIPKDFEYIQADDFKGILNCLTLQWVKINRGGPETLEGVLDSVTDDYAIIVANEEIIRVALFHIRNISYGVKIEKTKKDKDKSGKEENKNNKEDNKNESKNQEEAK